MRNTLRGMPFFADQLPGMGPFRAFSCYRGLWGSHHLVCTCDFIPPASQTHSQLHAHLALRRACLLSL